MNKGDEYQLGWSQLAAMQDRFNNMDMFRDYSYLRRRSMLYRAGRMAFLSGELQKYEREHSEHAKCLTRNQKRPPGHPPILDSEFDVLMAAILEEEEAYSSLCSRHREMRELHPAPREQYRHMLQHITDQGMLDREGYWWLDSPDEFNTMSRPHPPWVIRIVYSPLGQWLIKHLALRGEDPHSRAVPQIALIIILKTIQVAGAAALILIPVGILWLGRLSGPQAFGVVTGSTTIFSAVVTATHELDTYKTFAAVCAYMAVIVVFAAASTSV
ncbi:hypothetical protein MFIFM68171_04486 [Madurella fahalii]|uniref:DUF6594 domain-containing protein n=1 Tax=Madurella fahalii TaxID=1157608 RepID=A0ABQ0G967_9PEZI